MALFFWLAYKYLKKDIQELEAGTTPPISGSGSSQDHYLWHHEIDHAVLNCLQTEFKHRRTRIIPSNGL
jgi:hypothetical protein